MAPPNDKRYPSVVKIDQQEHVGMVREIFATIPGRYDLLNHVLSLGRDIAWRRFAVRRMRFFSTFRLLDVATGTADLALEAARRHDGIKVAGIDFTAEMLEIGRQKVARRGMEGRISLVQADALALPFPEGSFDAVSIAFGVRNIPARLPALREMGRVLVPGGNIFVLEMNFPAFGPLRPLFRFYLEGLLPRIAGRLSKNPAAYAYLADSILHFPPPAAFAGLMEEAGFTHVERHPLTFGITYLYAGTKA